MGEFDENVFRMVRRIPRGKVSTYGDIARMVGRPRASRIVGYALRRNPAPGEDAQAGEVPCHRVVFKDGRLCQGYIFGGEGVQRALLEQEGVSFTDAGHVDMAACRWDGRLPEGASEGHPTGPPPDFDWAAELGE